MLKRVVQFIDEKQLPLPVEHEIQGNKRENGIPKKSNSMEIEEEEEEEEEEITL